MAPVESSLSSRITEATVHEVSILRSAVDGAPMTLADKNDLVEWLKSSGNEGRLPDGVTIQLVADAMRKVLISPPAWLAPNLPNTPEARLALLSTLQNPSGTTSTDLPSLGTRVRALCRLYREQGGKEFYPVTIQKDQEGAVVHADDRTIVVIFDEPEGNAIQWSGRNRIGDFWDAVAKL